MGYPMAGHLSKRNDLDLFVYNRTKKVTDSWLNQYKGSIFDLNNFPNFKFDGLIFRDDLSILRAGDEIFTDKAIKSIEAGCDMILVCNNRNEAIKVINAFDENNVSLSDKIFNMTKKLKVDWDELIKSKRREIIKEKLKQIEELR